MSRYPGATCAVSCTHWVGLKLKEAPRVDLRDTMEEVYRGFPSDSKSVKIPISSVGKWIQ